MDVLHRQVEEYESEIRFLKDAKSPKARVRSRTPRRDYGDLSGGRSGDDLQALSISANLGAFEAALFRPALHAARLDASKWKASATISNLLELPPLHVPNVPSEGEQKVSEEADTPLKQLSSALSTYRMESASVKVVDLSAIDKSSRTQLHETLMKKVDASNKLDQATATARQWLESRQASFVEGGLVAGLPLVGRVKLAGDEPVRTIPTPANKEDLFRLQLHVVQ